MAPSLTLYDLSFSQNGIPNALPMTNNATRAATWRIGEKNDVALRQTSFVALVFRTLMILVCFSLLSCFSVFICYCL